MSSELFKGQVAFYTSAADVDKNILKYYTEDCKRSQANRAMKDFIMIKAWWDKQCYDAPYGTSVDIVEPRGYLIGVHSFWTGGVHEQRLQQMVEDYREIFLDDYDDDNTWLGNGEEPIEGYALEFVWVKYNPRMTVNDSEIVRLGAHRRHLDLDIGATVSNNFYSIGGEDGLPF